MSWRCQSARQLGAVSEVNLTMAGLSWGLVRDAGGCNGVLVHIKSLDLLTV